MKAFEPIAFDYVQCKVEVATLEQLLAANPSLNERKTILPFFKKHRQVAALCGVVSSFLSTGVVDRIAWEYDLFGEYAADLVVGDSVRSVYCFIEFEDAKPNSIFHKKGKKAARDWSPRFEHGYSQVTDWIQKLTEMVGNPEFLGRFGYGPIKFDASLIVGRRTSLVDIREAERFKWRRENVVVFSKHVQCFTFDELLTLMQARLKMIEMATHSVPKPTS
ncbi:MAG TPA: Shedu anti-phage system protein SduA domain-containing protein [Gemmata sp.]|jgi:hypothetical protein|nr:Shedu anti-phage system protein SduA domain-containing protein [Gemmata sp.]